METVMNPGVGIRTEDPVDYKHNELPFGKDLHGDALEKALTEMFYDYPTDIVVKKQFAIMFVKLCKKLALSLASAALITMKQ